MSLLRILPPAVALLILSLLAAPAGAATLTWPGPAPCAGVLQACVDHASDGDQILIATNTPITTGAGVVDKRLTLRAADGFRPVFRNTIVAAYNNSGFNGAVGLHLHKLHFDSSHVSVSYSGTGTASFEARELQMTATPGKAGIAVTASGGSVTATLYDNRISGGPTPIWSGLLALHATNGATLDVEAFYNRITREPRGDGTGAGIFVNYAGTGTTGTVKLHGNTVRGDFATAGILVAEGAPESPGLTSSFSTRLYNNVVIGVDRQWSHGIRLGVTNGQLDAQLLNNTVTRHYYAVAGGLWSSGATSGTINGSLHNNLLVGQQALSMESAVVAGMTNSHNLVNGGVAGMTMGTGTITAPARLISRIDARPAPDSPAIDAGDNTSLGFGVIFNALPNADADGLGRYKKKTPATAGSAKVDIGAYEYGDFSFSHITSSANTGSGSYITALNHPAIQNQPNANLFVTPRFTGVAAGQPVGSWEFSGVWSLYNKSSLIPMPLGAGYHVFAAGAGGGASRHVTTAGSVTGAYSQLPLADNPDLIVLAMQNYNTGAVSNPHQTGVLYFAFGGPGTWLVGNMDSAQNMPIGVGFSIYAQLPSPNVFRVTATEGNHSGSILRLDHPLLDGNPCAQPVVTRMLIPSDGSNFDLEYRADLGYWRIFDYNGMASGTQFNVLVNPAQAETCGGEIFSDGFE